MGANQANASGQGDRNLQRKFPFQEFAPRLYGLLLKKLGNDADASDLVQETYLRFLRVRKEKVIEKPEAYLFRIATNLVYELSLHQKREPTLVDDDASPLAKLSDTEFDARMDRRFELSRLDEVLADLPPLQGKILIMSKRDGFTRDEIAEQLGVSPHTVKKYLTKAITACRIRAGGAKFMTINRQIAEEAADWVVQLDEGDLTGKGNVDLADWLSRSPDHVQEFLLAAALVQVVSDLPEARSEALKRVLGEKADTVIPLMQNEATVEIAKPAARRRMIKIAPIAAAVALLVILASNLGIPSGKMAPQQAHVYATLTGEQRTVPLEDGSVIYLNTDSEVSVHLGDQQRLVMLERGEALFDVAKDPERPFRVRAGDHEVEAIGTAFTVYRAPEGLKVVVVEGVIEIAPTRPVVTMTGPVQEERAPFRLRAGEKVALSRDRNIRPEAADLSVETSWRSRELIFRRTRLDEIVAEYNRYTRHPISLEDEALASMKFTGTFDIDDPQALIAFLELTVGIETDRSHPDSIVLRAPESN